MKPFSFLLFLVLPGAIFAQTPTYEEVIQKEIVSNKLVNSAASMNKPYVIMVSIDGFRYDYAEKFQTPNILDLKKNGSSARYLIPSFPSKTFPNHYTLVTGLFPDNHGIVSNSFYDKSRKESYSIGKREAVEVGEWYGGIPIWNLAQMQGMCAASFFWVGSEADINGMHPKYYYNYMKTTPYEYNIRRVLEWLQMPEDVRPHMITLYFSLVDTQGHNFGPDSKENEEAVLYVDKQIGDLREGLKKLGLPAYLIVTSDHGMDKVSQFINLHDYINIEKSQFYSGPVAMIYTKSEAETDSLYEKLLGRENLQVYRRNEVPTYLHHSSNERIGDLVLITDSPYTLIYSEKENEVMEKPGGTHGYDPYRNENMGAIFYMEGPDIKQNYEISPIENVHVYPLVAHLLGLKIMSPIDGNPGVLMPVLKKK